MADSIKQRLDRLESFLAGGETPIRKPGMDRAEIEAELVTLEREACSMMTPPQREQRRQELEDQASAGGDRYATVKAEIAAVFLRAHE